MLTSRSRGSPAKYALTAAVLGAFAIAMSILCKGAPGASECQAKSSSDAATYSVVSYPWLNVCARLIF